METRFTERELFDLYFVLGNVLNHYDPNNYTAAEDEMVTELMSKARTMHEELRGRM